MSNTWRVHRWRVICGVSASDETLSLRLPDKDRMGHRAGENAVHMGHRAGGSYPHLVPGPVLRGRSPILPRVWRRSSSRCRQKRLAVNGIRVLVKARLGLGLGLGLG